MCFFFFFFLTKRTFIHKIEDKYSLETELEIDLHETEWRL